MVKQISDTILKDISKSFLEDGTQIEQDAIDHLRSIVFGNIRWIMLEAEKSTIYRGNKKITKEDIIAAQKLLFGDSK